MAQENFILPFQLEKSLIRGRIIRMDKTLDDILSAHAYPPVVSQQVAEVTMMCAILSSMLKYEGIFTLQVQGDGPLKMLVSDMVTGGNIRACATFDADKNLDNLSFSNLLQKGYMAFTVDQGEYTERYQGIVELKPEGLIASVLHYFSQSEQIATGIQMSVGMVNGQWRGCGIMVQQMPEDSTLYNKDHTAQDEDDWRRTMVLLGSVQQDELLSNDISAQDLLFRLFHEEGVRVFAPQPIQKSCRCSRERLENLLSTMPKGDIDDMIVDGKIAMTCEFCSTHYFFNPDDFVKGD
jgi:molecular chaperone Hsp33